MDTVFTNSENSKTSAPHRLLLNLHRLLLKLLEKINLKRNDKYVDLSNLYMEKYKKVIQKQ